MCDRYAHCPELNDLLHLQCKGILKIQSLEVLAFRTSLTSFIWKPAPTSYSTLTHLT